MAACYCAGIERFFRLAGRKRAFLNAFLMTCMTWRFRELFTSRMLLRYEFLLVSSEIDSRRGPGKVKIALLVIEISNAKIFAVFESFPYQIVATGKLSGE